MRQPGFATACLAILSASFLDWHRCFLPSRHRAHARSHTAMQAGPTSYGPDEYYTRRARKEGVPARAYYKLEEIDRRINLFRPGQKVLDLGCWPGSWTLYAARKVGSRGRVLGVDLRHVDFPLPQNAKTVVEDAFHFRTSGVPMLDVILSDMAPKTIGDKGADCGRSTELVELVIRIADVKLQTGGALIAKHFEGADTRGLKDALKERFETCRIMKVQASRTQSSELYLVAVGKKKSNAKVPVTWAQPPPSAKSRRWKKKPIAQTFDGW
eukprot:TRINITY_DN111355_c0_g1_i1.p1 TRINITY_DN111355_c0_g1~~TRINITY_DN111355_c0_g1_i1.p1  ORF type:complete len:277 (-),score=40.40 TRINITY_DN111355_c0_g1_i1:144-950(-)